MSRSSSTRKQSYTTTNSDSDDNSTKQTKTGFARPKSAVIKKNSNNNNDDNPSDKSYEFKPKNKKNSLTDTKSSFFERITGSDISKPNSNKYTSESDTESVTKTPTNEKNNNKSSKSSSLSNSNKNELSKPKKINNKSSTESASSSVDSSTDDVSLASDRPAPKNSQTLRSRSNSVSSIQRNKNNSDNNSKNKKRNSSSSSSSSRSSSNSSYSNSSLVKKSNKKQQQQRSDNENTDEEDSSYKGHVTKVKVNVEKKPPIDMSKWSKSSGNNRPSSSLEKPSDSMSDSSDTRRSISINDIPSKSANKHRSSTNKNSRKLNQTFDLELENESSSNEMTDVSPLPTPKDRKSASSSKKTKETKRNSMDMSSFYKILNEDINKRMDSVFSIFNDKFAKNSSSKSTLKASFDRSLDMTSSNSNHNSSKYSTKINKIDAENERLYAKLMSVGQKTSSSTLSRNDSFTNSHKPIRLTSSALNRQREQQRIEKENQQILKRLLKVKATKYLVKEEQIKDYDKKFGGLSLNQSRANSSHSMPLGFVNSTASMGGGALSSHNTSGLSTKRSSTKSTANNSRLSSAKSINRSNHHISIDANELLKRAASAGRNRPEWIERW